jgi:predicted RNase H-like nuclease
MKQSIAWHQECVSNREINLKDAKDAMDRVITAYIYSEKGLAWYKWQIETAVAANKDGFDSEKFLKPRKEKGIKE